MAEPTPNAAELSPLKRALLALEKMQARLDTIEGERREPIAVLGIGCRFPGGVDSPASFWDLLAQGRDAVGTFPADRPGAGAWQQPSPDAATTRLLRQGGFVAAVDQFDPGFFGISPREATHMDPQQRLLLQTSCEALDAAGLPLESLAGSLTGVFVGMHSQSHDYYLLETAQPEEMDTYTSTGTAHSIVANRLSYALDFRGPSLIVDTACSSSLVALHLACQSLRNRESHVALAAGVNLLLSPETSLAFSKLEFLSVDGRCKAFDATANGFVRAEGCGVIVLKRLSDARRDGDPILAVIRGTAVNQDGASNGLTAPNALSQQAVIRAALDNARLDPAQITLIETHGTGTALGDPIEVDALRAVFPPGVRRALGAVKSNLGHSEGAAGIAGVIKCVLALRHRTIPRNLHFKSLNPHIHLEDTGFFVPCEAMAWLSPAGPRCAGVSSFGFGGTNSHVIVQEAPAPAATATAAVATPSAFLLPLSARSEGALRALVSRWSEFLARDGDARPALGDIIATATLRRSHHPHRVAITGHGMDDLKARLAAHERGESVAGVAASHGREARGRVAFVFSGQGPQWFAMGRELLATEPVFRAELERIDTLARARAPFSILEELAREESASQLHRTDVAQPALFALQMGLFALWKHWGIEPDAVVGHSVGEVAAACAAGALSLEDAVTVVCHRGRLMHGTAGRGRMAAVEMPVEEARKIVAPYHDRAGIAAINTPESVTISGHEAAVTEIVDGLTQRGVAVRMLKVDYAFHSPAMDAVRTELRDSLRDIRPSTPSLTLVSTVTGRAAEPGACGPDYWPENIRQPVQFAAAVDHLIREGCTTFVEIAPHPVLSAAVTHRLEAAGVAGTVAASLRRGKPERETMLDALGALYVCGQKVQWRSIQSPPSRVVDLPAYPWQQKSYWLKAASPRTRTAAAPAATDAQDDWFYDVAWEARPRADAPAPRGTARHLASPERIEAEIATRLRELAVQAGLPPKPGALAAIESHATNAIVTAMKSLGFNYAPGRRFRPETLAAELGVQTRHHRLFSRMLSILSEEKFLDARADGFEVLTALPSRPASSPPAVGEEIESTLLARCGSQLAGVLRGDVDPLQLLFPGDGEIGAAHIYRDAPAAQFFNNVVAELVQTAARRVPRGGPLRVLEVGAGTGSTTTRVLESLAGVRVHYTFTDLSRALINEARTKFSGRSDVHCAVLDAERPPVDQGFADGSCDLVLAANVVHATADLRTTLRHLHRMLAPGGLLVLLETTSRRRWIDLTFGLTEGWWRFTDTELRPEHALLDAGQWCSLLRASGFESPAAIATEYSRDAMHEQAVLVARVPLPAEAATAPAETPLPAQGRWLLLADRSGLAAQVAAQLQRGGAECVVLPASDNSSALDSCRRLLADGGPWRGVVHAWTLDVSIAADDALPGLDSAGELSCGSTVLVAQALAQSRATTPARLWLLTRGAQPAWPRLDLDAIGHAPIWGLGRTIAIEHPEIWGGLIDVDPDADPARLGRRVAAELCAPDGEDQVALSEEVRLVPRLISVASPPVDEIRIRPDATYMITGGLGGLGPHIANWLVDQGARCLVLCGRRSMPDRATWPELPRDHEAYERTHAVLDLEQRGVTVRVASVDVANRLQMHDLFRQLATGGPGLAGIIHAAADIKFCPLAEMTPDALRATLRPKLAGTWVLHELTRALPLDFFILFSSATTLFGANRIGHYAASNQTLNLLAHWRRAQGLPALSVNWGAWEQIRLLGQHRDDVERFGLRTMHTGRALHSMLRLATHGVAERMVADVDWPVLKQAFETRGRQKFFERIATQTANAAAAPAAPGIDWKQRIANAAGEDRSEVLAGLIATEVCSVLGLDANEPLDPDRGLFEMGMDSLMSVQLKTRLARAANVPLPATLTFTYPTVTALTGFLLREAFKALAEAPVVAPGVRPAPTIASTIAPAPAASLADVETMTDEQVKKLLSDELGSLSADLLE